MAEKYVSVAGLKRKLIDEKNFYPVFVSSALKEMPEADVAPVVRGKWIKYSEDPSIITCSECDWGTSPEEIGFKFCPDCGAKMTKEN